MVGGEAEGVGGGAVVEDEAVVGVVHDEEDVLLLTELDHARHELVRIDDARGIVGRVEDDGLGVGPDGRGDLFDLGAEGAVFRDHGDGHAAGELHHLGVGDPIGRRENHLVLGLEDGVQGHHDGLFGAVGGDHVGGSEALVVVLLGVADDGLLEGRDAVGRRVPDLARIEQGRAVDDCVNGCAALRFAATQVDDRFALLPENGCGLVQLQGRRFGYGSGELADAHRVSSSSKV